MPNPLASPKSSDRDALRDLEQHPGYLLLTARIEKMLSDEHRKSEELTQPEQFNRYAGRVSALREVLSLQEKMITELNAELEDFKDDEDNVIARADRAFGYRQ